MFLHCVLEHPAQHNCQLVCRLLGRSLTLLTLVIDELSNVKKNICVKMCSLLNISKHISVTVHFNWKWSGGTTRRLKGKSQCEGQAEMTSLLIVVLHVVLCISVHCYMYIHQKIQWRASSKGTKSSTMWAGLGWVIGFRQFCNSAVLWQGSRSRR